MARDRSSLMTDRLEDVLGGVEDEIRRAEERLQLDVFSGARQSAACVGSSSRILLATPHQKISVVRLPT